MGVFDSNKVGLDAILGRITIDLHHFRPSTEYFLHYNLSKSARFSPRICEGRITVRLSMELNERKAVLDNMKPRRKHVFNAEQLNSIQLIKHTVEGSPTMTTVKESTIMSYVDEISIYLNLLYSLPALIMPTLLWRSSHVVKIYDTFDIHIPFYSMILFSGGILLVERPRYIPALFTALIGCVMLVSLRMQRNDDSPWNRPRSYFEYSLIVVHGRSSPITIEAINKNYEPKEEHMKKAMSSFKRSRFYKVIMSNLVREEWEDKADKIPPGINIVTLLLKPVQAGLVAIIQPLRLCVKVVKWEKYEVSFFITTFSFLTSFIFIFVPWGFLIQWVIRVSHTSN